LIKQIFTLSIVLFLLQSCGPTEPYVNSKTADAKFLHQAMHAYTDRIVHDIFSPPVASRNYVYPSIAAYEIMRNVDANYKSFAGQLNDLAAFPTPDRAKEYDFQLAAVMAFIRTAKNFIFTENVLTKKGDQILQEMIDTGIPKRVVQNSKDYAEQVSLQILAYADKDNYKQSRTFPRFSVKNIDGRWQPTPPGYMDGIEPHWSKIRPFVLDSANQFTPPPPTPYSIDKKSTFYKELMEVYEVVKNASEEEQSVAKFWDCNPYVSHLKGHAMYATKKITPGGHWIGITEIACKKASASFLKTCEAYAMVSIALADAFISCWDEKYRSNLIRPETVINEHLDEEWAPILQTPPFPEHTSGHSVISAASALTLTNLFGDNFAYRDTVELKYGLPAREFTSFNQAAEEAAVSRLYGGIHYKPAIVYGLTQGRQVGKLISERVKTQ